MVKRIGWGMIGGGEGSQIGFAHRAASGIDGLFHFAAGALDVNPDRGKDFGRRLGLASDRAYGDWKEMLAGERRREDRVELVTVATPNATMERISLAWYSQNQRQFDLHAASMSWPQSFSGPKLKHWVDQNLQRVVKQLIRKEIERIARRS